MSIDTAANDAFVQELIVTLRALADKHQGVRTKEMSIVHTMIGTLMLPEPYKSAAVDATWKTTASINSATLKAFGAM